MRFGLFILIAGTLSAPAFAQDAAEGEEGPPKLRESINCFQAKSISEFVAKFQNIDADKRETVDMQFEAKYTVKDDGVLPKRIFIRDQGSEIDFTLDTEGNVTDFTKIGSASETAELCSEDPSRAGQPRSGNYMSFGISSDVHFLKNDGYHSMTQLKDGLNDGKAHYKKMAPAAIRLLVPNLKYVMIEYDAEGTTPQYSAMKNQVAVEGLEHITFCELPLIKVKDLQKLGADGLQITGGSYNLTPVPGPKTLARFVNCTKDENAESDN